MATDSHEDRVAALERQVAVLLARIQPSNRPKDWRDTLGMFTGDEVMRAITDEALRHREEDRRKFKEQFDAEQRADVHLP